MTTTTPTTKAQPIAKWIPSSIARCGISALESFSPILVAPTKNAAPMAIAIGLMVVRIAAPCGLSAFSVMNSDHGFHLVTQAETDTANSVNIAVSIITCVSIRKNSHNTANDTTSITVAGKTTKVRVLFVQQFAEQRRGNRLGNAGGHQDQAVAVPVSISTCCVYIGTISSNPKTGIPRRPKSQRNI